MTTFTQGIGRWAGCAEVFDGRGHFLGNATDSRRVQDLGDGQTRIDLAFIGPLKMAGHYLIQEHGNHRFYQGPMNVGDAETLSTGLVDTNAYWAALGLSQRFFLMILPDGQTQLSLALMSRGEELIYAIVGENQRVTDDQPGLPGLINGTSFDLGNDPACGRDCILLHRPGVWSGTLSTLDENLQLQETRTIEEYFSPELQINTKNDGLNGESACISLITNGWQAWTPPGEVVGSYNLMGGRALSGQFHYLNDHLRCWRREVVTHDGSQKAVLRVWYRGGARIGVQYGVLSYQA